MAFLCMTVAVQIATPPMESSVAFPDNARQMYRPGPEAPLEGVHSMLRPKNVQQKVHRECSEWSRPCISK